MTEINRKEQLVDAAKQKKGIEGEYMDVKKCDEIKNKCRTKQHRVHKMDINISENEKESRILYFQQLKIFL